VYEFLRDLLPEHAADAAQIAEEMEHVRQEGTRAARKLSRDIYEVRIDGDRVIYRVLFSVEGERGRILLAIEAFSKKTRRRRPSSLTLRSGGSPIGGAAGSVPIVCELSFLICQRW
jgi:phage-related protein